jgi:hypothetical protein
MHGVESYQKCMTVFSNVKIPVFEEKTMVAFDWT